MVRYPNDIGEDMVGVGYAEDGSGRSQARGLAAGSDALHVEPPCPGTAGKTLQRRRFLPVLCCHGCGGAWVDKDVKRLVDEAVGQGWRAEETKDGWRLFSPDGKHIVHMHKTPSDKRWKRNAVKHLRQGGFQAR